MPQHIGFKQIQHWQTTSGHALEAGAHITGVSAKFRAEFLPVSRAMRALTLWHHIIVDVLLFTHPRKWDLMTFLQWKY